MEQNQFPNQMGGNPMYPQPVNNGGIYAPQQPMNNGAMYPPQQPMNNGGMYPPQQPVYPNNTAPAYQTNPQGQLPRQQYANPNPGSNLPPMNGQQPQQPMNGQPPVSKKAQKKAEKKKLRKSVLITLGIFALAGLIIGIITYNIVNKYAKQMTVIDLPGAPIIADTGTNSTSGDAGTDGDETDIITNDGSGSLELEDVMVEKGEPWDGKTRITCLAMGLDYRDWVENDGTPRSDTMMLLTYDPVTGYAGMLSIPRDTWVAIPDHGYGRINTAYSMGEGEQLPGVNGKPGGGAGLAMRTVELFLGIDIQYYAVVDFYGFIEFIDTIDKLAINVRDDITVDPLGEGNTVHLMAGVQDLDGATALAYARYRYTNGGDFERAQRQQDVIYAIYEQMVWQLPELLATKSDQLFSCIQRAIKTNLTAADLLKLAWTVVDIKEYKILRSVIAPPDQVLYDKSSDGQQILVPIPDKIREARDVIFSTSFGSAVLTEEYTAEQRLRDEGAKVTLLNGSTVPGIAEKTAQYLQQYGINVVSIGTGNAGAYNLLEVKKGTPYTGKFLQDLMGIPTGGVTFNYDPSSDVDLVLTITDAWANSNPMG